MADDELERLERERLDADRRYNDALTALDAALVGIAPASRSTIGAAPQIPEVPGGWRGWWLRPVRRWLAPWLEAQQQFHASAAAAIADIASREQRRLEAFERFQSALIVFLQHITAFVESKDRALAATFDKRLAEDRALAGTVTDLRNQVAVLQRATQMLTRRLGEPAVAGSAAPVAARSTAVPVSPSRDTAAEDYKYVAFEDRFRGSVDEIRTKLGAYLPLFEGARDVLDIGCGRGEFLGLLRTAGVPARGIDLNGEMIASARACGLDAEVADARAYVESLADGSLGGIFAAQVVEHLDPRYLMRLLDAAFDKLRPGAPIVMETINPACWLAFFSSYLRDPTHVRPVHPETLEYLVRASGFGDVSIRYSAPVADEMRMKNVDLPAEILSSPDPAARAIVASARVVNANAAILNSLAFSYHDYAVIGYRS